jgi:hypothetical protein
VRKVNQMHIQIDDRHLLLNRLDTSANMTLQVRFRLLSDGKLDIVATMYY